MPVRNEEALLPSLLEALAAQNVQAGIDISLCFLLDDCTDDSVHIIADAAKTLPFAVITEASDHTVPNAGRARNRALAMGQHQLSTYRAGALLTTDADTIPAPDWIAANCRALAVSDVVAGRIVRERAIHDPAQDRLEQYYDRLYDLRRHHDPVPWEARPAHHHVGGASLAFRAGAYAELGGFKTIASGEDAAIVDDAHRLGLRVRRDREVVVETSARRYGRAANGLADHLLMLDFGMSVIQVGHPADAAWQYRGHAAARSAYPFRSETGTIETLAEQLLVTTDHLRRVAIIAGNAESFAIHAVPCAPDGPRLIDLAEAEQVLAALEATLYDRAA